MPNKAVFFDRDHTLIEDPGYLREPDAVRLMPGAADAVRRLRDAGYKIIVVTNQSGVARGFLDEPTLDAIHARMKQLFADQGAPIDAIYYCPYLDGPEAVIERYRRDSELRKPRPGMFLLAAREHDIDLKASWAVGDSPRDADAGKAAGCRTVHIVRGSGLAQNASADFIVTSLAEAANCILNRRSDPCTPAPPPAVNARSERLLEEIAEHLRAWSRRRMMDDFTFARLAGAVAQIVAIVAAFFAITAMLDPQPDVFPAHRWLAAIFLQLLALTLFSLHRHR